MTLRIINRPINSPIGSLGFTLIELILVMAILSAVAVASAPRLSRFFHGQSLDGEARRFLSLMRYAFRESVASGVPLTLWIDARDKYYGLNAMTGYEWTADRQVEYYLDEDTVIELYPTQTLVNSMVIINFWPDGIMESEDLQYVRFERGDDRVVVARPLIGHDWLIATGEEAHNERGSL